MLVLSACYPSSPRPRTSAEKGEKVEFTATLRSPDKETEIMEGGGSHSSSIFGSTDSLWSFVIRYAMQQLNFDGVLASLGDSASAEAVVNALRGVEPVAAAFYNGMRSGCSKRG